MGRFTEDKQRVWILATLLAALLCYGALAFGDPLPTPTPGTPSEWSDWLDTRSDTTTETLLVFDPVITAGGTHSMPAAIIKQSLSAGVAVRLEHGYKEAVSPIDPEMIGGLRFEGYVAVALIEPAAKLSFTTDGKTPGRPTPGEIKPRPTLPEIKPRPTAELKPRPRPTPILPDAARRPPRPGDAKEGGVVSEVKISSQPMPGAVERQAVVVPAVTLLDRCYVEEIEVERIPWDSSYAIRRGKVYYKETIKPEVGRE